MDKLIKFNNQSSGRDKLFRLVQYSSKIIWANLAKNGSHKDLIKKLKDLESSLSTARKLFRFGRGIDTLYGALSSLHLDDPTLRVTISLSKISMAMYLVSDHVLWLARAGLINIDKGKWSKLNYQLWLYFIVMNLCRDAYEIMVILDKLSFGGLSQELQCSKTQPTNSVLSKLNMFYKLLKLHKDVALDTIKNGCDVCLPLAQLGYLKISPQTIGILGVVSSIVGMVPLLDPSYKLSP